MNTLRQKRRNISGMNRTKIINYSFSSWGCKIVDQRAAGGYSSVTEYRSSQSFSYIYTFRRKFLEFELKCLLTLPPIN